MDGPTGSVITQAGGVVPDSNVAATPAAASLASVAAAAPSAAVAPVATAATTTVNGDVYTNKWGPVQVQVAFAADGSIASVDAVQTPYVDGKSVRINDRAVPVLNGEALAGQSAQVDSVSGATYTSVDYERSMQSAIDAARSAGLTQLL